MRVRRWVALLQLRVPLLPQRRWTWTDWGRARARDMEALIASKYFAWVWVNEAVTSLVTAGLYREALEYSEQWPAELRAGGTTADPNAWALVEINLAEAEYNLGLLDAAFERIERLIAAIESSDGPFGRAGKVEPIVVSGTNCQRAWIAGLRGEHALGLQYIAAVDESGLPELYRAEVDYTRALLLLKAGRSHEAEAAAEAGLARALRPSSERNGLFLIGIILAERGEYIPAERAFERGMAHHYDAQGGDALLTWAKTLITLGRQEESIRVLRWCVDRDPQSAAAHQAYELLNPHAHD